MLGCQSDVITVKRLFFILQLLNRLGPPNQTPAEADLSPAVLFSLSHERAATEREPLNAIVSTVALLNTLLEGPFKGP